MLDDFDLDIPEEDDLDDFLADDEDEGGDGGGGFKLGGFNLGGGDNRRFLTIAGAIGGFIILSLICLAVFRAISSGNEQANAEATFAAENAARTQTAEALNQAAAGTSTPTPSNTPTETLAVTATDTVTPTASNTSPAIASATETAVGGPTEDPRTATVQALLTQAALAQTQAAAQILTVTATPTSSTLPDAGFLDDYGPVGLFTLTGLLLLVIFMARRLRAANQER